MTDFEMLDKLRVIFLNFTFHFHIFSTLEIYSSPIQVYSFHFEVLSSFMNSTFTTACTIFKFLQFFFPFITDTFRIIFKVLYIFKEFIWLMFVVLKLLFGTFGLCYFFSLYHRRFFSVHMLLIMIGNVKLAMNSFQLSFKVV